MVKKFKLGDIAGISPELTSTKSWIKGKSIKIEQNLFRGLVLSAKSSNIANLFGAADTLKNQNRLTRFAVPFNALAVSKLIAISNLKIAQTLQSL